MTTTSLVDLSYQPDCIIAQAAILLVEHFDEPRGWPTIALAHAEVARVTHDGFARAVLQDETVLGWVGGLPEYEGHVWELHPMVVRREFRRKGIGRVLVAAFEAERAE